MTETTERKNKYIGFRIAFPDYMRIAELCNKNNLTITDFILSAIYPAIEKTYSMDVKQSVKQTEISKEEKISIPQKNINATVEALKEKEKIINQKLKQLN